MVSGGLDKYSWIRRAETVASDIRCFHGDGSLPVNLEHLCSDLEIKILAQPLDDELSGMAFADESGKFVVVNADHHENRKRFTIAHELGHHILHDAYLRVNIHVDKAVLKRDALSAEGVEKREIEANAFAAELLMPRSEMSEFSNLDLSDGWAVKKAADKFAVSVSAFTYRLMNLGFAD